MIFKFSYFLLCCVIGTLAFIFGLLYTCPLATPLFRIPSHEPSTRSTDFASPVIGYSILTMSHEPSTRSTDFASPAELLSKLSIFWFSLLSPKDQQDKIEQISNKLVAEYVDVGSLPAAAAAGETEEDVRRKAFAMLFNEAPVGTRVELFEEFTIKFFDERRLCEGILLSGQLGSNEQQEEIDEIKQSRYAEFYLGLSIIWFKARWASDPRNLIQVVVGKAGVDDHIIEKLVNETEEDFKLRRFTESFKQLQFSSQEDIVKFIQDAVRRDLVFGGKSAFITVSFGGADYRPFGGEPSPEFIKMSFPDLRRPSGATATQGEGQGAITQGGQGQSQQ